jgi:hypothetical protein
MNPFRHQVIAAPTATDRGVATATAGMAGRPRFVLLAFLVFPARLLEAFLSIVHSSRGVSTRRGASRVIDRPRKGHNSIASYELR